MVRTHHKIISDSERVQFLSEKTIARGKVAIATLTSDTGFAAKNLSVYGQEGILR